MAPQVKVSEKSFSWDDALERVFLGMLGAYIEKNGCGQAFKWPEITFLFEESTNRKCTKDTLKNK